MKVFAKILTALWLICALLILTGGYRAKVEISQLNAFGWGLVLLGLLNWKITGSFIPNAVSRLVTRILKRFTPEQWLLFLSLSHIVIYTTLLTFRFQSFAANACDLGFVDQPIWATAYLKDARLLHSTLSRGGTYFSEHFSPLLLVFVPLYKIWDSVYWLFFVQSILLGSSAYFLYQIARKRGATREVAALLGSAVLLYQPLRSANQFDFREDNFFVPIFFAMILAIENRRWAWMWGLALLAFLTKENAALPLAAIGVWLVIKRERVMGSLLVALSLAVFAVLNIKVMPFFAQGASKTIFAGRLGALGDGPAGILSNLFFHPLNTIAKIFTLFWGKRAFIYTLAVLLPALPFLTIKPWKDAFPLFIAIALLSMNILVSPQSVGFHYECILLPFLFTALAWGFIKRADQWGTKNEFGLLFALLIASYGRSPVLALREFYPRAEHRCLEKALALLPQDATVIAQSALHPHVDHRKVAQSLGPQAPFKEELLVASFIEGLSYYGAEGMDNRLKASDPEGHRPLFRSKVVSVWCKSEICSKYSALKIQLENLSCLESSQAR